MQFEISENGMYLIDINGAKIAHVSFENVKCGTYNITDVYVVKGMRGKGVATVLLEFAVEHLKSIGAKEIKATCTFAARWLEKRGYTNE